MKISVQRPLFFILFHNIKFHNSVVPSTPAGSRDRDSRRVCRVSSREKINNIKNILSLSEKASLTTHVFNIANEFSYFSIFISHSYWSQDHTGWNITWNMLNLSFFPPFRSRRSFFIIFDGNRRRVLSFWHAWSLIDPKVRLEELNEVENMMRKLT